jgi:hypothetical protein
MIAQELSAPCGTYSHFQVEIKEKEALQEIFYHLYQETRQETQKFCGCQVSLKKIAGREIVGLSSDVA